MKLSTLFLASFLAFSASAAPAFAEQKVKVRDHRPKKPPAKAVWDQTGWTKLGEQVVNGKYDRDVLKVGVKEGRFSKLTIVVEESDLEMYDIVVHFGNGEKHSPTTKLVFEQNTRTRVIDLPGEARFVKKVEFKYGNLPGTGRARVEVWGYTVADAPPPPPPPPPPAPPVFDSKGWQLLGERRVNGKRDRDTISVRGEGRIDQLTFVVADSDVEITRATVFFQNGTKFQPKLRHSFREGSRTRVLDLPGNDRNIRKIELRYKNVGGDGRATVQVYGRDTKDGIDPGHTWDRRGWSYLGEQEVRGKRDRDTLDVRKKDRKFSKLTFVVEDSDVEMYDITVHFGNGETFSPKTKHYFKEGSRTGVIDLPGKSRNIDKIEFRYGNLAGGGRATVRVFGKPAKEDDSVAAGWGMIAEQPLSTVESIAYIPVKLDNKTKRLRINITETDAESEQIILKQDNGKEIDVPAKWSFVDGKRWLEIDLPGRRDRTITEVQIKWGSGRGDGAGRIEIWSK